MRAKDRNGSMPSNPRFARLRSRWSGASPLDKARNQACRSYDARCRSAKWPRNVAPRGTPTCTLRMRENVLRGPADKIEPRPVRQEAKAGRSKLGAALARQYGIEL